MNITKIPKKTKGKFREIAVPTNEEKLIYYNHLSYLNNICVQSFEKNQVVHGFVQKRSPVTNASLHIGFRFTLRFDLSDFFDTVKPHHLKNKIKQEVIKDCFPNDRAYQGLPTSPAIANIAAIDMDNAIIKKIKEHKIVYTRYADDLTFSFNEYEHVAFIKSNIKNIVSRCGFKLNENKTWLQDSKYGNRIITGLSVSENKVSATRKSKRKLRAAIHQNNKRSIKGHKEWQKVKLPSVKKIVPKFYTEKDNENFKNLLSIWDLDSSIKDLNKFRNQEIYKKELDNNVIITNDLIQILGMSNFSTNWTSCMRHPCGSKHRGAIMWLFLKGTAIAGIVEGYRNISGFNRPIFSARTLIHTMRNGKIYHDGVYGDNENNIKLLMNELFKNDIRFIQHCDNNEKVVGHVKCSMYKALPYMDNLRYKKAKNKMGENVVLMMK
jgi:Reverse transcriptase (RNA-dependent DNA polymerase)